MQLIQVKSLTDIKQNDKLIVYNGASHELYTVQQVKVTDLDGTEIILRRKGNIYFNLQSYLDRKSWVKDVCILKQ